MRIGRRVGEGPVFTPAGAGVAVLAGRHQVAERPFGAAGERYPAHRVRQVLVQPGDEARAVLAGQRPAASAGRARHTEAACLSAEGPTLVDGDVEAPLRELVRHGEPRDSAAEHGYAAAATVVAAPVMTPPRRCQGRAAGQSARGTQNRSVAKKLAPRTFLGQASASLIDSS